MTSRLATLIFTAAIIIWTISIANAQFLKIAITPDTLAHATIESADHQLLDCRVGKLLNANAPEAILRLECSNGVGMSFLASLVSISITKKGGLLITIRETKGEWETNSLNLIKAQAKTQGSGQR